MSLTESDLDAIYDVVVEAKRAFPRSGQLAIYKKVGAAQFTLIRPRYDNRGIVEKTGAVLLQVAPGAGTQKWDWEKKITFAIGVQDIMQLVAGFDDDGKMKLFHKNERDGNKGLDLVEVTEGRWAGTYQLHVRHEGNKVMVPLTGGEFRIIMRLLEGAVPALLGGWSA